MKKSHKIPLKQRGPDISGFDQLILLHIFQIIHVYYDIIAYYGNISINYLSVKKVKNLLLSVHYNQAIG